MSSSEARKIVQDGLDRKKEESKRREEVLEGQAQELRRTINGNHVARTMTETQRLAREQKRREELYAARREARAAAAAKELEANRIIRSYGAVCLVILLVSALTKLPVWGAETLIFSLEVFPAVRIYRLYVPMED